jgi:hypothetical protein
MHDAAGHLTTARGGHLDGSDDEPGFCRASDLSGM